jgi:hypothetical protein
MVVDTLFIRLQGFLVLGYSLKNAAMAAGASRLN